MESFECKGKWNLHNSNENHIEGILKFDPINGGNLFLKKSIETKYDIIDGQGDDGTVYTLIGCFYRGAKVIIKDNKTIKNHHYYIDRIIKGQKFNDIDKIKFSLFRVSFLHLPEWLGMFDTHLIEDQPINSSITSSYLTILLG